MSLLNFGRPDYGPNPREQSVPRTAKEFLEDKEKAKAIIVDILSSPSSPSKTHDPRTNKPLSDAILAFSIAKKNLKSSDGAIDQALSKFITEQNAYDILSRSQKDDVANDRLNTATTNLINAFREVFNIKISGGKKTSKSLDSRTVVELKEIATKRGVKVTGLKKSEIIAKLRR